MTAVDLEALEAEALDKVADRQGIEFAYKGLQFKVPPAKCWPLEAQRRMAHGDVTALEEVLGKGVLDDLAAAGMTGAGFDALLERLRRDGGGPPLPRSSG